MDESRKERRAKIMRDIQESQNKIGSISEEVKELLIKKNLCIAEAYEVLQQTKMKIERCKLI